MATRRRIWLGLWGALVLLLSLFLVGNARASSPCVTRAELHGVVSAGTASYLKRAIGSAERDGCAVLVPLDTPGGTLDSTREIVTTFLSARVPVVVYVSPGAARAGSAGAFITLAAHVAAMSPAANIGAAHPVMLGSAEQNDKELAAKIESDTAALARAIAEQRDRNVQWAESAVRESASITANEALDLDVIDLIASSERDLLDRIDGTTVEVAGREATIRSAGAEVRDHAMTLRERTLAVLGSPNVAYALVTVGMLALMFELFTPGIGASGAIGALSLVLGVIGMNVLPVHVGGVILLAGALAFFAAEIFVTSYGLLTLGGVACLLIGGALLFDRSDPSFLADASVRLSWAVVIPLAIVLAAAAIVLGTRAAQSRRRRSPTGVEGLRDEVGSTIDAVDANGGFVRVHGERWNAVSDEPLPEHTPVRVVDVRGLTLRVTRAEHSGDATS